MVATKQVVHSGACTFAVLMLGFCGRYASTKLPRRKTEADSAAPQSQSNPQTETETVTQAPAATTERKNAIVKGEQLQGDALLKKSTSMPGVPIDEVAKACGYYRESTNRETGEVKVTILTSDFMSAMLKAQSGIEFAPPARVHSRRNGRPPLITVGGNGNIVVGSRYSEPAGFPAGSKVKVEASEGQIVITAYVPTGDESEGESEDDGDLNI